MNRQSRHGKRRFGHGEASIGIVVEQLRRKVPGGVGTYAAGLVRGIVATGLQDSLHCTLLASRPLARPDELARFGLPLSCSAASSQVLTGLWDLGLGPRYRDFDLVHATSLALPPTPRRLVVTVHDLLWRRAAKLSGHARRWHESNFSRAMQRACAVVCSSIETAREIEANLEKRSIPIEVIEPGVDHLPAADRDATTRFLSGLGASGPYLVAVGTLEPRKNLARLMQAYSLARQRDGLDVDLLVVGPVGWGPRLSPVEGVVLTGEVTPGVLAGLYERAVACCHVPLAEGFGLPVVEAMQHNVPVLSSEMPAARGATLLVDPLEVDSIATGMVRIVEDDELRHELMAKGRGRVAPLRWQHVARSHQQLWERVLHDG